MATAAAALAMARQHNEAVDLILTLVRPDYMALWRVAETLLLAGRHQQALDLARTLDHGADHQRSAAVALAGVGQYDDALDLARTLFHPDHQASALTEVAVALAAAGQEAQALSIARQAADIPSTNLAATSPKSAMTKSGP
ncbi:hypothetical protein ABZX62_13425 [Streptomyces flavidovirens]|uniref:Tetratricopeptide repeat protein n=1 Tax=Streptomyces flavidovirens TaxID=67298 RepID=A0ABW6RKE0_9ACTN